MKIKDAIQRSCCLPGLFYPINDGKDTIVDGGVIDNFPLYFFDKGHLHDTKKEPVIFDSCQKCNDKTLGFLIVDKNYSKSMEDPYLGVDSSDTLKEYVNCLLNTILTTSSRSNMQKDYWEKTITITINDLSFSDMELSKSLKKEMYKIGVDSAKDFLKNSIN
jgi:hypothetical protein